MDLSNENVIHIKTDEIEYLQFRKLNEFGIINCCTLSAKDVDFKYEKTEKRAKSREKIFRALNIKEETIAQPTQTHTDCVEIVENPQEKFENVDGLISKKPGINLMLSYADCTPILLYDPVKNIVANVHSGWRGTVQRIGAKAVLKMINELNSKPEDILAFIGPCIEKCHFIVEDDVKQIFENTFPEYCKNYDIILDKNEVIDGKRKYHIDTEKVIKLSLEDVGIKPSNIIISGICTVCNSSIIHSHRAEGKDSGRNIAIIGLP